MGVTCCRHSKTELSGPDWTEWMTEDYDERNGFTFSTLTMPCCYVPTRLGEIVFESLCMFGRFAIQVADTMKTYSEEEILDFEQKLAKYLRCPMRHFEAHY
jgi:hypothetical protein